MQPALITRPSHKKAFTLLEVVIAVAIFAGAIVIILALFGPVNRSIGEVSDSGRAARLVDSIEIELRRIKAVQTGDVNTKLTSFAALVTNGNTLRLVASADGTRVVRESEATNDPVTGNPRGVAPRDRYYVIDVSNFAAPLNYVTGSGFVAVNAMVRWPYQVATGPDPTDFIVADLTQSQSIFLNYALAP